MQGKRIPRYPSAVLFYLSTVETSAQTGATFCAPAIFEFFDTLRMTTTTLDELKTVASSGDDEMATDDDLRPLKTHPDPPPYQSPFVAVSAD